MKDRKFLSDLISIFLEILAWGLLIVVAVILLLKWIGFISSPEKMEIDLSINGFILSWLFWITKEFVSFKSKEFVKLKSDISNIQSKLDLVWLEFKKCKKH